MSYNVPVYMEQDGKSLVVGSSGSIVFEGSGVINDTGKWDDLRVPANAVKLPGAQAPAYGAFLSGGLNVLWFDPGTEESVYFNVQIPHDWKPQSDMHPHVHWCTTGDSTSVVRWALEYTITEIGSTFPAPVTLYTSDDPSGNALHEYSEFDIIDMSGINSTAVSAMFVCRLYRDSSNAADTYAADAGLLEFDFHYQKSRLGSTAEAG